MIVGINKEENKILNDIFKRYSSEYDFYYYGSRVKGNFRNDSDLDVMIKKIDGQKTPYRTIDELKCLFDISKLHFIVNFVDYFEIKDDFYKKIENHIIKANLYEELSNKIIILDGNINDTKINLINLFQETSDNCYYTISIDNIYSLLPEKYKINQEKIGSCIDDFFDICFSLILNNRNIIVNSNFLYKQEYLEKIIKKFKDFNNIYIIGTEKSKQEYYDYILDIGEKLPNNLVKDLINFIEKYKPIQLQKLYEK